MRGDVNKNMIDIAVCGAAALQRAALHIILDDMERVHRTYRELPVKRRVPLPDKPEVDVSYEHLRYLEETPKYGPMHSYLPEGAGREYVVGELLNGIPRDAGYVDGEAEKAQHAEAVSASKLGILFLAANPTDTTKLRLDEELREVREELTLSNMQKRFDLQHRGAVRPKDMVRALLSLQPAYIHFSGHGAKNGAICMENQDGRVLEVTPEALGALFEAAVRNSLLSMPTIRRSRRTTIVGASVPYVIGMNTEIGDGCHRVCYRLFIERSGLGVMWPPPLSLLWWN